MDLQTLANVAQVLSAAAVIAAIIFGLEQMRQFRLQRRDFAAAELVRSFEDASFVQSFRLITALPNDASAEQLRAAGPAMEDAALSLGVRFEAVGLLVFRGVMSLSLVNELTGGVAIEIWSKTRAWTQFMRTEKSGPRFLEWFQWLVERLQKEGSPDLLPAFERHRDWRPARE